LFASITKSSPLAAFNPGIIDKAFNYLREIMLTGR
jgi:hypothetical protein